MGVGHTEEQALLLRLLKYNRDVIGGINKEIRRLREKENECNGFIKDIRERLKQIERVYTIELNGKLPKK